MRQSRFFAPRLHSAPQSLRRERLSVGCPQDGAAIKLMPQHLGTSPGLDVELHFGTGLLCGYAQLIFENLICPQPGDVAKSQPRVQEQNDCRPSL